MSFTEHEVGQVAPQADPTAVEAPEHLHYLLVAIISFLVAPVGVILAIVYNQKVTRHNKQVGATKVSARNFWLTVAISAAIGITAAVATHLPQNNPANAPYIVVGTGPVAPVQPAQEAPPAPSQAPETPANDLISTLSNRSHFVLTRPGGYSFNVDVSIGQAQHLDASAVLTAGGSTLSAGSTCKVDRSTDAGVPFTITVTNTTSGFTASAGYAVAVYQSSQLQGLEPEGEIGGGDASSCFTNGFGGAVLPTTGQLSPGASTAWPGFVIIRNYFSPNKPQGDSTLWENTALSFGGGIDNQRNTFAVENASGPGLVIDTRGVARIGVALDGQSLDWIRYGFGIGPSPSPVSP